MYSSLVVRDLYLISHLLHCFASLSLVDSFSSLLELDGVEGLFYSSFGLLFFHQHIF